MLILGPGGTGKSLLISAISETFKYYNQESILAKCATTGIAASNIGGQTLHSWAALPIIRPKSEDWILKSSTDNRKKRTKNIEGKMFLIEDKVSMEDKALSYDASRAVSHVKGGDDPPGSAHKPYGGMHVIKFGDFHQFPPVGKKGSALYCDTKDGDRPKAKLGRELFLQFDTVVFLNEQVRVTDKVWTEILERLRIGQCSESDINEIRKLVVGNSECDVPDFSKPPWDDAILVTSRHGVRDAWNEFSVRKHCQKYKHRRYTIPAEDYEKNSTTELPTKVRLAIAGMKEDKTGKLEDTIHIALGMRAMVEINFAIEADIANGTRGRIEGIILDEREPTPVTGDNGETILRYPPAMLLFKPDGGTKLTFEGIEKGLIPLTPSTTCFTVKTDDRPYKIVRRQYAMTPGYAFTDYKSQGQTIDYVLIDLAKPPSGCLTAFSAYVSLSRSRGRSSIRLLRNFDTALFQNHPSEDLRRDMIRLQKLSEETKRKFTGQGL